MINFSLISQPDYLEWLLRRAVRKESVAKAVVFLRWALIISITAALTAIAVHGINTYLEVKNLKATFDSSLIELQATTEEPSAIQAEKIPTALIAKANIFGPLGPRNPVSTTPVKTQTKMPLILIGTFLEKKSRPYAIIEDEKKKVQDVFVNEDIVFGDAKLVGIFSDRVELNRNGQIEILMLDDAPDIGSSESSGNTIDIAVDSNELDLALENLPMLLTQARAVPYFKDGKPVGLRMFSIKAGSLYEKVGLQNGDILKTINGNSLSDMSQAMRLFEMLKQERSINVSLERNREEKEFRYQIR